MSTNAKRTTTKRLLLDYYSNLTCEDEKQKVSRKVDVDKFANHFWRRFLLNFSSLRVISAGMRQHVCHFFVHDFYNARMNIRSPYFIRKLTYFLQKLSFSSFLFSLQHGGQMRCSSCLTSRNSGL